MRRRLAAVRGIGLRLDDPASNTFTGFAHKVELAAWTTEGCEVATLLVVGFLNSSNPNNITTNNLLAESYGF
jgi:hypothetical protein